MPTPTGRLAPSPTGLLHLGHARSFLLAWWSIRSRGGRMVLRIEDLDGPRVKPGLIDAALRDLEWLGLDWDGNVHVQSEGLEALRDAARSLAERGLAYPCVCSRADIQNAQSAPHASVAEERYPGTCRGRFYSLEQARAETGRDAGLRFAVPPGHVRFHDGFAGPITSDPASDVGDFLVQRRDGIPAYQLAAVVDDARDGVTEVLRGDDLLPSTGRQALLLEALGLSRPTWIHVPLVVDSAGRRLAKRDDDLSLTELRASGVDPRAIVSWAAGTAGIKAPERARAAELAARFDLGSVPREPAHLTGATLARIREARTR